MTTCDPSGSAGSLAKNRGLQGWGPWGEQGHGQEPPQALTLTVKSDVSMLPRVGPFSTMKLRSPVRMVETDQAGFQVSGWKSVMERQSLQNRGLQQSARHGRLSRTARQSALPRIALKSSIGGYHINTRRFKGEFSGKNQFSMVIATCIETERSVMSTEHLLISACTHLPTHSQVYLRPPTRPPAHRPPWCPHADHLGSFMLLAPAPTHSVSAAITSPGPSTPTGSSSTKLHPTAARPPSLPT